MSAPQYGWTHRRIREALIKNGCWIGAPCPRCFQPMWPGQRLDLDHETDQFGRRTGRYLGLSHARCNRSVNAFGRQSREARRASRSPAETEAHNRRVTVRQQREWKRERERLARPGREW